jgi:DNA-directed RNA polymerase specialized sigma24 family protein
VQRSSSVGASPIFKPIDSDVRDYREHLIGLASFLLEPDPVDGSADDRLIKATRGRGASHDHESLRVWLHLLAGVEARRLAGPCPVEVDSYLDAAVVGSVVSLVDPNPDLVETEILTRRRVLDEVARLPDKHRFALLMRDGRGLSVAEIANITGTTRDAVRSLLYRARSSLRGHLGP